MIPLSSLFKKYSTPYSATLIIIISFFLGWVIVFGQSVFLNSAQSMYQRPAVSSIDPIGADLRLSLSYAKAYSEHKSPYIGSNLYPPLAIVFFSFFISHNIHNDYSFIIAATMIALISSLIIIDKTFSEKSVPSILVFFIVTAFFSYGLHFELERGQFNLIAMMFFAFSLLFYKYNKLLLASIFFTLAVQLKVYPLIFIVLFFAVTFDKRTILFILGTIFLNFLALFVVGANVFFDFIRSFIYQSSHPFVWIGNLSLYSFCSNVAGWSFCDMKSYPWLLLFYFFLLFVALIITWRKRRENVSPYLFAIAGMGSLLIPSLSHDYKLSIVSIVLLPLFKEVYLEITENKNYLNLLFLSVITFLYTLTLFSYIYPSFLYSQNKAPVLYSFATVATLILIWNTYRLKFINSVKRFSGDFKKEKNKKREKR